MRVLRDTAEIQLNFWTACTILRWNNALTVGQWDHFFHMAVIVHNSGRSEFPVSVNHFTWNFENPQCCHMLIVKIIWFHCQKYLTDLLIVLSRIPVLLSCLVFKPLAKNGWHFSWFYIEIMSNSMLSAISSESISKLSICLLLLFF